MAATKADVVAIAPELSAVTDDRLAVFLAHSELLTSFSAFGTRATLAQALLVAHLLTLFPADGSGGGVGRGAVTSETVGSVSRSYAAPAGGASSLDLEATRYGRMYLALRRQWAMRLAVVP